jgi:iron complex outermembrane recepter protein
MSAVRSRSTPRAIVSSLSVAIAMTLMGHAAAQDAAQGTQAQADTARTLDRVRVTGSNIRRTDVEAALPITVFQKADIDAQGITSAEQLLMYMNIAGNGSDNLSSNAGIVHEEQRGNNGVSGANLRGQGADATLVLLNGRRQTVSSVAADDGASFVDLNALVPSIAVGRVEVLKDGASPVYGSDAVAGVINVITRDSFTGLDAFAEWRGPTEYSGSGAGPRVAAIAGRDFGALHLTGAVEWSERAGLEGFETDFVPGMGISTLGQPGGFYILNDDGSFAEW